MNWTGRISFAATFGFLSYLLSVQAHTFTPVAVLRHGTPVEIKYWDSTRKPLDKMVDVTNELGIRVLAEHDYLNLNNIAFSPYGLMGILVALYEGVDGDSSYQIQHCLQLPWDRNIIRIGFRDIHRSLKTYFVPEEGFLAGLALNDEHVTFTEHYKSILRFYGFDLQETVTTNATSSESSTPAATTTGVTSDTTTPSTTIKQETTTLHQIPVSTTIVSTTVTAATATTVTDTEALTTQTHSEPTTQSTITQPITSTVTETSTTQTETAQTIENTNVPTTITATEPSTTITSTEASTTITTTVVPTTILTTEAASTPELLTTLSTTETSSSTTTTATEQETPSTPSPTESESDRTTTTTVTESTVETLQRKKKSIVDFLLPNVDYSVEYRSFNIGLDKTEDDIDDDSKFTVDGLRKMEVPYMHYDAVLDYAYLPHLEATGLRLPLDSDRYYLLIVLPNRAGLREISRLLVRMARESDLSDVYGALRPRRVRAMVPSFVVKGHVTLTTDLQKLGIRDVFDPRQRDFTPMTNQSGVYVRSIEQDVSVSIRKYQPDGSTTSRYPVYDETSLEQQILRIHANGPPTTALWPAVSPTVEYYGRI